MSRLRKFLRDPTPADLWHVVPWLALLMILTIYGIPWLWLFIAGVYVYFHVLRWSIKADKREKWTREWSKVMNDLGEYNELHDEGK